MRVGILLSQQANQSLGTDVRVSGILQGLRSQGVEAIVFVPGGVPGDQPDGHVTSLGARDLQFESVQRFARYLLAWPVLGNAVFWSPGLLRKQIGLLAKAIISLNPDVNLLQGEQQLASMAAVEAGRILGIPVVTDLHAIWSEELAAYGSIRRGGRADRNIRSLESRIVNGADHVTVVSPEMREYLLSEQSADPSKISVVPNGAYPRIASVPMRSNPHRVVFAGMLSPLQNLHLLLEAMSIVSQEMAQVEFFLTGKGELAGQVRKQCEKMGLRPGFFWFNEPERLFQFLASCDVGLLPANKDLGRQMAYPTKLYVYMSVGLPVVTNRIGSWSNIVEEEEIGVVTDTTPEGFAKGILDLLQSPSRIKECGERALELLRTKYAYTKETEKFVKIYSRLIGHRASSPPSVSLRSG